MGFADEQRRRTSHAAPHRQSFATTTDHSPSGSARHRRRHHGRDDCDARAADIARGVRQRPRLPHPYTGDESPTDACSRRSRRSLPRSLAAAPGGSHDSPAGIDPISTVVETAGVYKPRGFVDDASTDGRPGAARLWRRRSPAGSPGRSRRASLARRRPIGWVGGSPTAASAAPMSQDAATASKPPVGRGRRRG